MTARKDEHKIMGVPIENLTDADLTAKEEKVSAVEVVRRPNGKWSAIVNLELRYQLKDGRYIEFIRQVELGNAMQVGKKPRTDGRFVKK